MRQTAKIGLVALALFFVRCNNEGGLDCFRKAGDTIVKQVEVPYFETIILHDDVNLVLVPDSTAYIRIVGGTNILNKVKVESVGESITIYNENSCNWVRGNHPIEVFISNPSLKGIELYGYGHVTNVDTLGIEYLKIVSQDSPSDVNLTLRGGSLRVVSNSYSNFYITGTVDQLNVGFYYNEGMFLGESLEASQVSFSHNGHNLIKIKSDFHVVGSIENSGNVVIYGVPTIINIDVTGSGGWATGN